MSEGDLEEKLRRTREEIEALEIPQAAEPLDEPAIEPEEEAELAEEEVEPSGVEAELPGEEAEPSGVATPEGVDPAQAAATELDGHKQRNALTAAEQAIRALAIGDPSKAKRRAYKASELDQIGAYTALVRVVDVAVQELETAGTVSDQSWDRLAEAVGPGPLQGLIDEQRSAS